LRLAGEGVRRPLEQAAQLSATPSGYLVSLARIDVTWSRRFFTRDINVLFPGVAALVLAVLGFAVAFRGDAASRRRSRSLALLAALAMILSFGPATPIYTAAYHVFVPLQGLRVPARFGYLVLLAVALLAAYGVAAVERRFTSPGGNRLPWAGALALCAVTLE